MINILEEPPSTKAEEQLEPSTAVIRIYDFCPGVKLEEALNFSVAIENAPLLPESFNAIRREP